MGKIILNGVEYSGGGSELPSVTAADNGKSLKVVEGAWSKYTDTSGNTVKQITTANDNEYPVLLSGTTSSADYVGSVYKNSGLTYDPHGGVLKTYSSNSDNKLNGVYIDYFYGESGDPYTSTIHFQSNYIGTYGSMTTGNSTSPQFSLMRKNERVSPSITLDALTLYSNDIKLTNATWDGTHTSLKDAIQGSGGITTLRGLTDVTLSSLSNGQVLKYNYSSAKWVNGYSNMSELGDIVLTSPTDKQVLMYDSTSSKWVNGTNSLNDLGNVDITTPANGQVLKYNNATGNWENANESGGGGGSYTDVTGTLLAGNTTVTITDSVITTTATFDFYTDTYGVNPTNISVSTGSITLTFEEQASDVIVKVRVS